MFALTICPAFASDIVLPAACAAALNIKHPDWKPYAPDDSNAPRYKGFLPRTIVSVDLDSDGIADVAVLAMFQQQHPVLGITKGVRIFACLSSRKYELTEVGHIATEDSLFELEAVDSARKNRLRALPGNSRIGRWGLIWHHNSYACIDYWYVDGKFVEGEVYCPNEC
jgi:hypothetical protein